MNLNLGSRVRDDEGGFTLIELLVVVIIVGILAAIAIPVFLNQRQKGWRGEVQSDLRNHAIVMETRLTDAGTYDGAPAAATSSGVTLTVPTATATTYCIQAFHANNRDEIWSMVPGANSMQKAACSARTSATTAAP